MCLQKKEEKAIECNVTEGICVSVFSPQREMLVAICIFFSTLIFQRDSQSRYQIDH